MELAVCSEEERLGHAKVTGLIIDWAMLTRQHTSASDLALGGAAVYLDVVGKFIFPDSLSGFQESQREMEKYSDGRLLCT